MSRPALLLFQLLVVGFALGAGVWWIGEKQSTKENTNGVKKNPSGAATEASALPLPEGATLPSGDGPGSEALLQDQVEYLQGQLALLQEENENLILYINKLEAQQGDLPAAAAPAIDHEALAQQVMEIRKLSFDPSPKITPLPPSEMQARLAIDLGGDEAGDPYTRRGRAWEALGLIPTGTDTLAGTLAVRAEAEGAFVPTAESDTLFTYEDDPLTTGNVGTRIMDLGNLLQEQHLSPPQPWIDPNSTLDEQIAALALRRGDAALVRFQYELAESLNNNAPPPSDGRDENAGRPAHGVPFSLREAYLIFPLLAGGEFVKQVYDEGGWDAVNAAHQKPPSTTAEIFHPELYITGDLEISTPNFGTDLSVQGTSPLWDGVAGELGCLLVLKQQLPESMALQAAEGWQGDRHLLYGGEEGAGDHLLWESHWADAGNAGDFFEALRKAILNRYNLPFPQGDTDGENGNPFATSTTDGTRHLHLSQPAPNRVRLIDAGSAEWLNALQERFPASP